MYTLFFKRLSISNPTFRDVLLGLSGMFIKVYFLGLF